MREIKFRGKTYDTPPHWVFGDLYHYTTGEPAINYTHPHKKWLESEPVLPDTVGQFTGHCDVMGTDMYEGDIVTGYFEEDEWPAVVEWDEVSARFVLSGQNSVIPFDEMGGLEVTIIGTVHDNPELLEACHD